MLDHKQSASISQASKISQACYSILSACMQPPCRQARNHKPMGPLTTGSRQDRAAKVQKWRGTHLSPLCAFVGTIINASDNVLIALDANREVPARKQQDLVALVKTVYALTHTSLLQRIRQLAHTAAVVANADSPAAAVVCARHFWKGEFSDSSPAGARWRALVQTAHGEDNSSAYPEVVQALRQELVASWFALARVDREVGWPMRWAVR